MVGVTNGRGHSLDRKIFIDPETKEILIAVADGSTHIVVTTLAQKWRSRHVSNLTFVRSTMCYLPMCITITWHNM